MRTKERKSYHSWAKTSAACVCAHAHCSTGEERAKGREREEEKKTCCPAGHQESNSFCLRRLLSRLTLGQPKIMLGLLFKALKTFLILRNTG